MAWFRSGCFGSRKEPTRNEGKPLGSTPTGSCRETGVTRLMPVVDVRGLAMAYDLVGSGDPIVLVAGTGYPGATWYPALVERLSTRHRVLTFDHRGTGHTPVGPERLSTRLFAED